MKTAEKLLSKTIKYRNKISNHKLKCIDCGREISIGAKRCRLCFNKFEHGVNNPYWKGGPKHSECIDCGREISIGAKRCRACFYTYFHGKNSSNWKGGPKHSECIDCGKKIKNYSAKRCKSCYGKSHTGKNNGNYKGGKSKCIDCGRETNRSRYDAKRCRSCQRKYYVLYSSRSISKKIRAHDFYKRWRSDVFKRDGWICQTCTKRGIYLEAHHKKSLISIIKENNIRTMKVALVCKELWDTNNGVTLCKNCHNLTRKK